MEGMTYSYKEVKGIYKAMRKSLLKRKIHSLLFFVLKNHKVIIIKTICLIWMFFIQPELTKMWDGDLDMLSCVSVVNIIAACLLLSKFKGIGGK